MNFSIIMSLLATAVSIYAFLCFLRIIFTWVPSLAYSKGVRFLASVCDPFLDKFRHRKWLVVGSFDLGPAVAICILGAISSILNGLAHGGRFSIAILLAYLVQMVWSIISSLLTFIILLFLIRLIFIFVKGDNSYSGNSIMYQLDSTISSIAYRITNTFTGGKRVSYKAALITAIIAMVIINCVGGIVFEMIARLISSLPF